MEKEDLTLQDYGIRAGTMIQVFQKQYDKEYKSEQATSEQINKAVSSYRTIFKEMASSSTVNPHFFRYSFRSVQVEKFDIIHHSFFFQKTIRPEILKQVLEAYPEFHTNLGAYAILRDSILIQSMTDYETVTNMAKQYPILIHSAEFVTKTLREHLAANKPNLIQNVIPMEDSMSDSSSSESDSPTVSPNQRNSDIRQISRDQLTQALLLAGTASTNSLSNIAQRNQQQSTPFRSTSTTAAESSTSGAAAQSSASLISSSMFSNALSQALSAAGGTGPSSTQSTSAQPNPAPSANQLNLPASNDNLAERYATELQTMREMGLYEELINIQALVVSNGNVEAAINLVLSGLGNFN